MEERTCKGCPAVIIPGPRERRKREWCSGACRQRWWRATYPERAAEIVAGSLARASARKEAARPNCANCGQKLKLAGKTYCNASECAKLGRRLHARAVYAADPEAQRRRVAASRAARTAEQIERDRAYLRAYFTTEAGRTVKRSADSRRRAREIGARVEEFKDREVFDRDGWRCGICGKRIRRDLKAPHPMSVSLDHIVPLSHGGEHSRANTRAAHLRCNVLRGAARGEEGQQLALI